MASFNLDDNIKFKLTEPGEKILADYLVAQRKVHGIDAASCYRKDDHGYIHLQAWEFMRLFGPHMKPTFCGIVEGSKIIFCE